MLRVMGKHRDAAHAIDQKAGPGIVGPGRHRSCPRGSRARPREDWDEAVSGSASSSAYRNAQATVLAPTGTIGLVDGLRHDGHRARLRAREVQEARRRRLLQDRQPERARGAAQARATARRRSGHRGVRVRHEHVHRRAALEPGRSLSNGPDRARPREGRASAARACSTSSPGVEPVGARPGHDEPPRPRAGRLQPSRVQPAASLRAWSVIRSTRSTTW